MPESNESENQGGVVIAEEPMAIGPGVAVRVGGVAGVATSFPEDGKVIVETEDGKILPYDESEVEVVGETTETIGTTETTMPDGSNESDGTNRPNDAKESQSTASPLGAIPVDAKGKKLYEQAPIESTINAIYNNPDLDETEADALVAAKIAGATKRIAQLEKKKPKMGEDEDAYIAERAKWREQLEAEQASLAYWQGVQEARAKESTPSPLTPQSQGETRGELDSNGEMGEIGEISAEAEGDDVSERDSKVDKDTNVAEEGSVTEGTVEEETPIEEKQTQEETGELTTSPLQDSSQSQTSGGLSEDLTEVVGETDKLLAERKRAMEAWLQAEEGADKDAKWGDYSQAIDALESYAMGLNDEQLATLQSHYGKGEVREIDDEISRRDEIKVKNAQYDELLSKQYPIERKERKGTGKLEDALSKDATRPVMTGVYHDEDGYAVATDAKVLVADKREYNGRKKGKIIGKDGKEIPGNYPKWKLAIPAETEALPIDLQDLSGFIGGVKAKLKENGIKPKDYGKAVVMIKTGSGTIVYYPVDALETWLNGAMRLGATGSDVGVSERNGFIVAKTKNGVAMLASKAGLAYNDTGIVYEVNPSPSTPQSQSDSSPKGRGALEKQVGGGVMENATEAQRLATEAVITSLEASGIEVVEASDAMAEAVIGMGGVEMSAKKKRALETASVQEEHQPTVVSSADGAKVLNNLDNVATEYEEKSNQSKTFLGDVAKALGAERKGSGSQYVTFETKNGKVVTIRLSNHNATVSNFDNNGEADGISIVVSAKGNNGMTNDGDAHVVEHYYDAIKLRRAEGKPLADIVRSIKQALYSGEFTDTTGLAERQEVNLNEVETLRTPQGVVYGWTDGKKVYLTKEGMNPETPIHEYTHLWARAMMQGNAEGWQSVKDLLRGTPVWNEVMSDANYADIHGDEDAVASECLSRLSGRENAKRMEAEARKMIDEAKGVFAKADAVTLVERMKKALQEFWSWVGKNLFDIKSFGSIEEVTDRVLYDLIHNSQFIMHNSELPGIEKQIIGERGASALDKADEATHRMDNLGVAREMEADGKDAKAIRMATGWERGADGKWRYEIEDYSIKEEKIDFITNQLDYKNTATIILKDLLEDAQGLFAAYPELRNMRVVIKKDSSVIGQGELQWYDAVYDRQIVLNEAAIISHFAKSALERYGKADVGIIRIKQGYDPTTKEKFTNEADKQEALKTYIEMMNEALLDYHRFKGQNKDIATSILTHEIQHAIQFIEGFARGSSPKEFADVRGAVLDSIDFMTNGDLLKGNSISNSQSLRDALNKKIPYTNISLKEGYIDNLQKVARKYGYDNIDALVDDFEKMPSAFEQYHRTAGEVEARNASARMGMSADERRATLLSETEDVAREDQIFLMENSGVSAMAEGEIDINPLLNVVKTLYTKGKEFASKLFSMKFFDVAKTPDFMKQLGLRGDKFTIRYGVIARHFGKDSEHALPYEIWEQLPEALLHPFAITKYYEDSNKQKQKGYRLYTSLQLANGAYVVVSAEVKNSGRDIDVNAINTVFGRSSLSEVHDKLIYTSETITPEQQSLLNGNNPHQYTAERELSTGKGSDNIGDVQGLEDHSAEEIKEIAREYIEDVIAESGFDAEVVDLAIYGSRRRGDARDDSDLDIVVEYSGNAREDDLFNALNDAETQLEIDGVKVDINPITKSKSGTLGEFMERAREYDESNESNGSTKESQPLSRGATAPLSEQEGSLEDDGLLFRGGEVFYSNAEEAVRNIKQEKATPEQWLAMIQKNGGLKAGEDKWLGLSDWLNKKGKRKDERGKSVTLTKEEVLEFINQNKIKIEEVGYGGDSIASAQSEFDELAEELGGYDEAFEEMVNRYGDDFREAVWYDEVGQLHLEEGYEDYGDILGGERGINPTRMSYTTEGLENNKEIALVVPSVDPYNAHDEIHFGDAGEGRAVAWVRFGETTAYDEVVDIQEVTEFHEPFKGVVGHDIYKPIGGFRSGDYVAHGKARNGGMIYVVYINDKQIPVAHNSLEEAQKAMNEYYKEHPRVLKRPKRVLVIDEIQSKRHQDGREKGYRGKDVAQREARIAEIKGRLRVISDRRSEISDLIPRDIKGLLNRANYRKTMPENDEFERLRDEEIALRGELDEITLSMSERNAVPDAPFEKNWHELAMKRMLRYAAENGFDKVAWTTGAQQAERYDIGRAVDSIESIPYKAPGSEDVEWWDVGINAGSSSMDLRVDANGTILQGGTAEMNLSGKQLSEVIGKELADKILSSKDDITLQGDNLRLGGEGMKGFYDKMLPSFMNKYGKKWGVKVGEVTMPELQEGYQTMHSIDVTDAMRESVMEGQPMFRDGSGALSDTDLSYANDPFAKALGKSQRSKVKQAKFAERERKYMRNRVAELAEKLHLDNVEVVESSQSTPSLSSTPQSQSTPSPQGGTPPKQGSGGELNASNGGVMSERKARAKGWFDTRTGKIVINISNHTSVADVERTLLHEAVAHYGLRQLFGKQFDTFLDNVYLHADAEVRAQIIELAKKHGWEFIDDTILAALGGKITRDLPPSLAQKVRTATEEYLASLAENTNFEALENNWGWWQKIKQLFMDMLESIGWDYKGPELSDNELRYLLWRSYENMVNPGRHRSILGMAEDVAKQYALGVGNYSTADTAQQVADSGEVYSDEVPTADEAVESYKERFSGAKDLDIAVLNNGDEVIAYAMENGDSHEEAIEGLEHIKTKGVAGGFVPGTKKIVIFAFNGIDNIYTTLFHEHAHYAIEKLGGSKRIMSLVEELREIDPQLRRKIESEYKEGSRAEEMITCSLEAALYGNAVEDLLNALTPKARWQLEQILNIIGYEQGRDYKQETERYEIDPEGSGLARKQTRTRRRIAERGGRRSRLGRETSQKGERLSGMVERNTRTEASEGRSRQDEVGDEGILFRDGESDGTREEYNRRVRRPNRSGSVGKWDNLGWRMKEAYQDSMLSLKELQDVIAKKYGLKEIPSWMNAYLQENLMSSRNKAASDVYMRDFYNPMMKEVQALIKKGVKYEDLVNYMIAKHGLERNVVMAERDAKRAADEAKKKGEDWQKAYDEALKENRERDYSGLTALTGEESVVTAEPVAEKMVEEFEGAHETDALWEKVNAATKETLRKSYEGGLMSKETYESTEAMYEHYIPLRGWDTDIASDVYEYLMSDRPLLSPALKTAKGRTSLADDPIATIGMMADSTIAQANRNKMKQAFLNFYILYNLFKFNTYFCTNK